MDFLYVPADVLLIVPLPDLILGLDAAFFLAGPALAVMYPLPERFTLPDAYDWDFQTSRDRKSVV